MRIYYVLLTLMGYGTLQTSAFADPQNRVLAIQAAEIQALKKANQDLSGKIDSLTTRLKSGEFVVKTAERADSATSATTAGSSNRANTCGSADIAEKARMLRARDDNHWMRFRSVDGANHDVFDLWRSTDGTWHNTIATSDSLSKGRLSCYREEAPEYISGCSRRGYVNVLEQNANAYSAGLTTRWWRFCCAVQP